MLFVCHSNIWHKHCLKFLLGVKMAPRENENNAFAKFGVTNKEHYGMLWYFWSGQLWLLGLWPLSGYIVPLPDISWGINLHD